MPPPGSGRGGLPRPLFLAVGSAAIFLALLLLFCPQLVVWKLAFLPVPEPFADVQRAWYALRQLEQPFVEIESRVNEVLEWRLLPPLLGHALHLPPTLYLALGPLGALALLAQLLHHLERETGDRLLALAGVALAGTGGWFFVSTGWLAYFDAWYGMGLVAVAMAQGRAPLVAACLLAPWVDERFLFGLPAALAVRALLRHAGLREARAFLGDAALCAALIAPYAALRLGALALGDDPHTVSLLREVLGRGHPPERLALGAWHGWRLGWLVVAAGLGTAWWRGGARAGALVLAASALFGGAALVAADDYHRSAAVLLPTFALGVVGLGAALPRAAPLLVGALLLGNAALPASHFIRTFEAPVRSALVEAPRLWDPPERITAGFYERRGERRLRRGALDAAEHDLRVAEALAPDDPGPRLDRAALALRAGRPEEALAHLEGARPLLPAEGPVRRRYRELLRAARRAR